MIKSVLKGMVIGIANIIPGVSGGTMMVAMGIYDKLIHCITHLFKEFKQNVLFLLPIAIGMVLAIVGGSFGIEALFNNFPLQANLLFVGLIVGGLPAIWKNVKGNSIKAGHIVVFLAFFAFVVGMALLGDAEGSAADLSFTPVNVVKLFVVGVIAAATMVIPGVSGSMVLLLLGYYNSIIGAINDFIAAVFALEWSGIWQGVGVLAPFGVGVIVGVFAIAKLIEIIFEKYPLYAYWAIIGLIAASPIAIFAVGSIPVITVVNVITGVLALALGFVVAFKLGE